MSNHRNSQKGDGCTTATATFCNGAYKNILALQKKHFDETGRYLKVPKAANLLLAHMKLSEQDLIEIMKKVFDK